MAEDLYWFDEESADRVCRFFENHLTYSKGEHDGKPFTLLPWQRQILRDLFGTKRKADGTRRYRLAYIEIPRKQGKTIFASGIALYMLCADNEPGAEVYSIASDTPQAGISFTFAKTMVERSALLSRRIDPKRWHLSHPKSGSIYKALSGEQKGKHGLSVHGLIADELHDWRPTHREIWDAMLTSMGARRQPLTVAITTAGHGGDESLCRELHDKAVAYLKGEKQPGDEDYDDTFYPVLFGADQADDWEDEQVWAQANPSLGQTVSLDFLRREHVKAKESVAYENEFRRLYLNQWTQQATRWLSLDLFDSRTEPVDLAALEGEPCYVGMDLSQSYDLAAVSLIFPQPDKWIVWTRCYCPRETVRRRSRDEGIPYQQWAEEGYLVATDANGGQTTDYDRIEQDIIDLANKFRVIEVAYDPYNATSLVNHLTSAGLTCVPVYQRYEQMSIACKQFERRLVDGSIMLDANPVLRYCAANVEIETDRHQNIRLVKPSARGKYAGTKQYNIDAIVATVIAYHRAMLTDGTPTGDTFDASTAIAFV